MQNPFMKKHSMSHHFLTHRFVRILTVITFAAPLCFSQDIKVKGTVKDTSGKAIAGAWAYLETARCSTKTNSKGEFSFDLNDPVGVDFAVNASQNARLSAHLKEGVLFLNVFKSGPVEITIYALNGQAVFSLQKVMDAGTHAIKPPLRGNGVCVCRIKTGACEMLFRNTPIGGVSAGSSIHLSGIVTTAKKAFSPEPKDILTIKAKGFVDYEIAVWNYDTNYKDIKMLVCEGTVTDADGNVYQSVKIGEQIWATRSLNTTKFNDGTEIPQLQDSAKWAFDTSKYMDWSKEEKEKKAGWCNQEIDKKGIAENWGKLYNWYAAAHPKIAPKGWHVPTRDELYDLRTFLVRNGYNFDGTKYPEWDVRVNDNKTPAADMAKNKVAKSVAARIGYKEIGPHRGPPGNVGSDIRTNNRSGFNCKPLGSRWCDGSFHSFEFSCYLWSATESFEEAKVQGYLQSFHSTQNFLGSNDHETRSGFQVCILKDK